MSDETIPFCVFPPKWRGSEVIVNLGGPDYRLLFWSDTDIGLEHVCDRGERGTIICAPRLQIGNGHSVTWTTRADGVRVPTVSPSCGCFDCGLHGFIREGRWADV